MKMPINENLIDLSRQLTAPLYVVGGYVRNFLIDGTVSTDVDLCSNVERQELVFALEKTGFKIVAEYPRTRTILFTDENQKYEFTAMRVDGYTGGEHKPIITVFTDDIVEDARRRDFKCNAIYYDVKSEKIIDPLNGLEDIKNKVLDTVKNPDQVFCNDGLRLMRLARFTGELGFTPTREVMISAKKYADNILEIAKERVTEELKRILISDTKYSFSDKQGHYKALKVLDETRVLDRIIPELTLGRGMEQRKDYHKYDVLEHSLKAVQYADKDIRIPALFHDIAKPKQYVENGNFYKHDKVGAELVKEVLSKLKFDKKTIKETEFLTRYHMLDMDLKLRNSKLRKFIVENYLRINKLFKLKQADYSASYDDLGVCPTIIKWQNEIEKIETENVPLSIKDLDITAKDITGLGFSDNQIGEVLSFIFNQAVINPKMNKRDKLLDMVYKYRYKKR